MDIPGQAARDDLLVPDRDPLVPLEPVEGPFNDTPFAISLLIIGVGLSQVEAYRLYGVSTITITAGDSNASRGYQSAGT